MKALCFVAKATLFFPEVPYILVSDLQYSTAKLRTEEVFGHYKHTKHKNVHTHTHTKIHTYIANTVLSNLENHSKASLVLESLMINAMCCLIKSSLEMGSVNTSGELF